MEVFFLMAIYGSVFLKILNKYSASWIVAFYGSLPISFLYIVYGLSHVFFKS